MKEWSCITWLVSRGYSITFLTPTECRVGRSGAYQELHTTIPGYIPNDDLLDAAFDLQLRLHKDFNNA